MSVRNEVYVGNYPSNFTEKDILFFFQDFEGIELENFVKDKNKCFCFLKCLNKEQVENVVSVVNGIDVCGRRLVVRASSTEQRNSNQPNQSDARGYKVNNRKEFTCADSANISGTNRNGSAKKSQTQTIKPQETFVKLADKSQSPIFTLGEKFSSLMMMKSVDEDENNSDENPDRIAHSLPDQRNNADCGEAGGRNCSGHSRFDSDTSAAARSSVFEASEEPLSYIFVFNFPIGTSCGDLYELFGDFFPVRVFMVHNGRRHGRQMTEAVIYFADEADATGAIMTLGNTSYFGRNLFVYDADDLKKIQEMQGKGRRNC